MPTPADLKVYLLCVEHYRNAEATYDAEDYFVDGIVLIRMPLDPFQERSALEATMKQALVQLQTPEAAKEVEQAFPKFHALKEKGGLFWFHLMRQEHKDNLPKDFHTNAFTEDELLGIAPAEDPDLLPKEIWFDRDGDPIEGPPDRLMGLLYN